MSNSVHNGFLRDDATLVPVTVDVAVGVAPFVVAEGFLRDANYALVTTAAPTTPIVAEGFLREGAAGANYYALVSTGAAAVTKQLGLPRALDDSLGV